MGTTREGSRRIAAIWWRVSRPDQLELSPETQISACLSLAEADEYQVPEEHVTGSDWGSLTVWDSPAMQRLKDLVASGAVPRLYMYDPDRLPSRPVHRMMFRAMVQEFGVTVRCVYGEVPTGDIGEVMEFLTAWQKEKQVLRARQGAKDGMRDRAALRGPARQPEEAVRVYMERRADSARSRRQPHCGQEDSQVVI